MAGLDLSAGEGRFGMVYGRAGRGKTRTAQWYAANNDGIYLRTLKIWRTSELDFLRTLCRELGEINIPNRKGPCFNIIVDRLIADPRAVFIDEIEKLPALFLEVLRDLADVTAAPFVVIGEEELVAVMKQNRRIWSRTFQNVEFGPITPTDITSYAKESTGVVLSKAQAGEMHRASGGDWRIIKRDFLVLVDEMNAGGVTEPGDKQVKSAITAGLSGR